MMGCQFITKAYIQAALPDSRALLVKAEETSDDVRNVVLSVSEQALSVQLSYMLALLTKNRALDRVQAAGEGEGLGAWRGLQEQWSRSLGAASPAWQVQGGRPERHRVEGAGHPELREAGRFAIPIL